MAASATRRTRPDGLLFIAFYAFIVIGMPGGLLNIAWTYIQESFDMPLDALGILLTASMTGNLTVAFASGRLISRFGAGTFLLAGSLCGGVGAAGFALSPAWITLLLAAFLSGMGSGSIDTGINTFVSSRYSTSHLNWVHACFGVGLTIGPPIVTFTVINLEQSWRWSYAVIVAAQLALGTLLFLTRARWNAVDFADDDTVSSRFGARARETLAIPVVLLGVLLFAIYGGVEMGVGQLSNTLLVDSRGVSQQNAGFWISVYWGSFTVGRFVIGAIADRINSRVLLRTSILGVVLGTILLALNITNSMSVLALALIGVAQAPMFATLIAETPDRVGRRHTANTVGFQVGAAGLGGALLPGLAGILGANIDLEAIAIFFVFNAIAILAIYEIMLHREDQAAAVPAAAD
ncbi:MAG: MFS transporter [Anaerolineae bacterium]|nr:MFS transporter [Anaerolineae bacterium]